MARKPRIEVEGGLYHIITRGNNRQVIFKHEDDYLKMLSLLETQKARVPFYLYAYCLMPNHIHLLVERRQDAISRLMHRVLTGYSQYYNRRYRKVGHLLQGRYKAILCQSDQYLAELVRYIHLNPVRAKLVRRPEEFAYSSHREYLGIGETGLVDVDPVLRRFGARRRLAREKYAEFIRAGMKLGHRDEFYRAQEGRILGSEEFIDSTIHRIGEGSRNSGKRRGTGKDELDLGALVDAVEKATGIERKEFCGRGKGASVVLAKEALILLGRERGATNTALVKLTGLTSSAISKRYDSAREKMRAKGELTKLVRRISSQLDEAQR